VSDPFRHAIDVVPLGDGRYQVSDGPKRQIAFAAVARDTWVFLDGRAWVVNEAREGPSRKPRADDQAALTAPMPATVLAIHVAPGQPVARNEVVMVLEAMKMELPIRSPRKGIVKAVGCRVGELVQPGSTLLEIDEGRGDPPAR
jgi:biotin carboxyl carrier protein